MTTFFPEVRDVLRVDGGAGEEDGAVLIALALVFAVVNGANDGGALVAAALKPRGIRPVVGIVALAAAVAVTPLVLGTGVAQTLTEGLVPDSGASVVAIGVVAGTAVVGVLTWGGLPTSLTLAVVGGIVGVGVGLGSPVAWSRVGVVLLIAFAAPVVGAAIAASTARLVRLVGTDPGARLRRTHRAAFGLQAVAYASNDGQKMIAVLAVAGAAESPWALTGIAVMFALGALLGLPAAASTLSGQVTSTGPQEEVTAEMASSIAVLGSAGLGAPVSMTQSVAGALVGTGMRRGVHRGRWRLAARRGLAWALTLPAAAIAGVVGALATEVMR